MASYLLYIVTGAALALMAARHFLLHVSLPGRAQTSLPWLSALHHSHEEAMHWPEAALCGAILLFGLWLSLSAALRLTSLLLHLG